MPSRKFFFEMRPFTFSKECLKKYKYLLVHDVCVDLKELNWDIQLNSDLTLPVNGKPYIQLSTNGFMRISSGYAWNGMSRYKDTKRNRFPSLVHDALYQLLRESHAGTVCTGSGLEEKKYEKFRKASDEVLKELCKRNRLWFRSMQSGLIYSAVRLLG